MSKHDITKPAHSKKVEVKKTGTKNVLVKNEYVSSLHAKQSIEKQLVSEPLVEAHLIPERKVSKTDIVKDANPGIEQLNNALKIYIKDTDFNDLILTQQTQFSFTDLLSNKLLLVMIIRKGIPYSIFTLIRNITPFSMSDWASYLDISGKSLLRYKQQDKPFKPGLTEKIIELAEVTNLGMEVFGDNEKFRGWLETPNYALGNLKPFDLLRDSYGKEMIIGELTRIDHGILA